MGAIGAVDVAPWDIAGKAAGMPIDRLLGWYRDRLPACASSQVLDSTSEYADQVVIDNCELFEVLPPDEAQKYGLTRDLAIDRNGMIAAPAAPGLGADIDFELIERTKLAVLT